MNPTGDYELSNPQRRIWLTEVLHNHKDMANIGYLIELKDKYDLDRLAQAIKYTVKANHSLRLRFKHSEKDKSELLQYLPEYEEVHVEIIKVGSEEELTERIEKIHRERFDIYGNYLCSFAVFSPLPMVPSCSPRWMRCRHRPRAC